ncbi:MAG: DUF3068 domain-containing protein [Acidobacteria bacterium]|nr:DUF3068 domain-containing protein [Acidobacteriota bacterium]
MSRRQSIALIGTGIFGAALLIFGIVWSTVIFDRFEKVPSDLNRIVDLDGTYTVVDTSFTDQLTGNAAIAGLLQSDARSQLTASNAITGLLANPALGALIANPEIIGLISDPAVMQLLGSPELAGLLGNPVVLGALADPAVIGGLSDPATLAALATANPTLAAIFADPSTLAILTDPTFAGLVTSGALTTLMASPEILRLLGDPAVAAALANPVVGALIADPAALGLLLDPRTTAILASPADLPTIEIPVNIHRIREGQKVVGDNLSIRERITTTNTSTGGSVPTFDPTDLTLLVDRSTKVYVEGTEGGRKGQWGLPFHTSKTTPYSSWISAARQPFDALFEAEDKTLGLDTYRFVVDVTSAPMGVDDPAGTGLPLVFDTHTVIWVEPNTGAGVDATVEDTVSALAPDGTKYVRFANDLKYRDTTVLALVDEADNNKDKLKVYGTILPWASGIVGAVILALTALIGLMIRRGSRPEAA